MYWYLVILKWSGFGYVSVLRHLPCGYYPVVLFLVFYWTLISSMSEASSVLVMSKIKDMAKTRKRLLESASGSSPTDPHDTMIQPSRTQQTRTSGKTSHVSSAGSNDGSSIERRNGRMLPRSQQRPFGSPSKPSKKKRINCFCRWSYLPGNQFWTAQKFRFRRHSCSQTARFMEELNLCLFQQPCRSKGQFVEEMSLCRSRQPCRLRSLFQEGRVVPAPR